MVPLSILDLSSICEGSSPAVALHNSIRLAQRAEALGYKRFWLAEHHSLQGVASAATAVVIGQVAAATRTLRVGAGGIMLPNHAPLLIAEQFGTLESLFPGRIDLGLGRAPGSGSPTQRALRRPAHAADSFVDDVLELQHWFAPQTPEQRVVAVPGAGLPIPLWILGSSTYGAGVAAALGLPYAFASHFAPQQLEAALRRYREEFRPSPQLQRPHVMLAANVIAADSEPEARHLSTSLQLAFLRMGRGQPGRFPPPQALHLDPTARLLLDQTLRYTFVGTPSALAAELQQFCETHGADELICTVPIFDFDARCHALAQLAGALGAIS